MPKEIKESEIKNLKQSNLDLFDESQNELNCVKDETKLIIVGTITPKGNSYFYCSKANKIYGYLDAVLNTNLKELKNKLHTDIGNNEKQKIVEQIKQILIDNKIAFLDVLKYVIRKDEFSPYDNDIKYYTLDYDVFKNINPKTKLICNSKFALMSYEKIASVNNLKNYYVYLPQRGATKQSWLEAIKSKL